MKKKTQKKIEESSDNFERLFGILLIWVAVAFIGFGTFFSFTLTGVGTFTSIWMGMLVSTSFGAFFTSMFEYFYRNIREDKAK